MGQRGVGEQVLGEVVAEVQQARRTGAVLVQIAGIVGARTSTSCRGRRADDCGTTGGCIAGHPGVLLFIGAAQAGSEIQAFGQVPGALCEQREAVGFDMTVADTVDVVQRTVGRATPDIRLRSVKGEGFVVQVGAEVIGAEHVIEEPAGRRRQAKLLGVLLVLHRNPGVVEDGGVQAVIIARGEIPPAVSADGRQGEVARQRPVGLHRCAALMHGDMLVVVQVDLAVRAVDQCRARCIGPGLVKVGAIDGRPGAEQHAGAGAGIFFVVVADPAQVERFVRLEQQLATEAIARAAVQIVAVEFVLDIAVAAGAIRRKAPGELVIQRAGNRALGLEVAILAHRRFDAAFRGKGRRAGADVDHAGGGVLAEQGALRTTQHFELLDVHQVEYSHAGAAEVNVVDVQADTAFQAIAGRVVAQATDRHAGLARMHVGDVDAGHQLLQILDAIDPLGFQGLAADYAHRGGYVLRAFFAAASRDRHGCQLGIVGRGGFCRDGFRGGAFGRIALGPAGTACQ
ncbi:hypothetical protein D3C71_1150810 [compost metagenome]